MNPWFNTCELQTKARTLSTKTLGAHSPDWAQIIQMECGKKLVCETFSVSVNVERGAPGFLDIPDHEGQVIFPTKAHLWNIWDLRRPLSGIYLWYLKGTKEETWASLPDVGQQGQWRERLLLHGEFHVCQPMIMTTKLPEFLIQYKQGDKLPEQNMIMRHLGPTLSLPNNYSCSHS